MDEIGTGDEAFSVALSRLIRAGGMTLSTLHRRLTDIGNPVSMATLSYWRSGARQPDGAASIAAIESIEDLFGVERGHLVHRIRPVVRGGRLSEPKPVFTPEEVDREIAETARALGTVPQAALRDLSASITALIGDNGDLERQTTCVVVRAREGLVREVPMYDLVTPGAEHTKTITDVSGARLDRSLRHPRGRVVCDVLVLDDPIPAGSTAVFEFAETIPSGFPDRRAVWHGVDRQSRQILIWVHFAPGAEPDWCEEYSEVEGRETVRMLPAGRRSVHTAQFGFGPGVLGIRWGYDSDD